MLILGVNLLVIANKQDDGDALGPEEIESKVGAESLRNISYVTTLGVSALENTGIKEVLAELANVMKNRGDQ